MGNSANTWGGKLVGIVAFVVAFYVVKTYADVRSERAYEEVLESIDQGTVFDEDASVLEADPYEFVREAYSKGGSIFLEAWARGAEVTVQSGTPDGVFVFDPRAEVSDLGTAMRGIVRYTGKIPDEDAGVLAMVGEVRSYYHSSGLVGLEAGCFTELGACMDMAGLVGQAETRLLQRLESSGVGGILPDFGECWIEDFTNPVTGAPSDMAFCWYDPATILAFTRLNAAEARLSISSAAQDPEMKRVLKDLLREAVE